MKSHTVIINLNIAYAYNIILLLYTIQFIYYGCFYIKDNEFEIYEESYIEETNEL